MSDPTLLTLAGLGVAYLFLSILPRCDLCGGQLWPWDRIGYRPASYDRRRVYWHARRCPR